MGNCIKTKEIENHIISHKSEKCENIYLETHTDLFLNTAETKKEECLHDINHPIAIKQDFGFYICNTVKQIDTKLGPFKFAEECKESVRYIDSTREDVYKGGWSGDKFNGYGVLVKADGSKYEGHWKDGLLDGYARTILYNGEYYEGFMKNGKPEGEGIYCGTNTSYNGSWKDGRKHGNGEETYTDGSKYIGHFVDNVRNGTGKFIWPNGCYYEGNIKDNKFNGYGEYSWENGRDYKGEWSNDEIVRGVYKYVDGSVYEGEFYKNKKHGYGKMEYNSEKYYEGYWQNDKQNGLGKYVKKGELNLGFWRNGKLVQRMGLKEFTECFEKK
jgi:hypothetical protein